VRVLREIVDADAVTALAGHLSDERAGLSFAEYQDEHGSSLSLQLTAYSRQLQA
jgi:hypothetical protein